jgi:hypothetical protein
MVWADFTKEQIENPKGFEDETKRKMLNKKQEVSKDVAEKEEHGRRLRRNLEKSEAHDLIQSRNV